MFFFFQAEDGIRDFCLSRGLGDVYKRQPHGETVIRAGQYILAFADEAAVEELNRIFGAKE